MSGVRAIKEHFCDFARCNFRTIVDNMVFSLERHCGIGIITSRTL